MWIIRRAFSITIKSMGTTAVALGGGAIGLLVRQIVRLHRDGWEKGWPVVKASWVGDAGIGVLVACTVWLVVFLVSLGRAIEERRAKLPAPSQLPPHIGFTFADLDNCVVQGNSVNVSAPKTNSVSVGGSTALPLPTTGDAVVLSRLIGTDNIVRNREFEDVTVNGPALVVLLSSVAIKECIFRADYRQLVWVAPDASLPALGAIGIDSCEFHKCEFVNVAFVAKDETQATLLRQHLSCEE